MKLHNLKIKAEYAAAKLDGKKPFEIRKNDRRFRVGDIVKYTVVEKDVIGEEINKEISNRLYEIVYITDYEQKPDYVVFGEREVAQ